MLWSWKYEQLGDSFYVDGLNARKEEYIKYLMTSSTIPFIKILITISITWNGEYNEKFLIKNLAKVIIYNYSY